MSQLLADCDYDKIGREYIEGRSTMADLARENDLDADVLRQYAGRHGWGPLKEEFRDAYARKPINDLLPAPVRVNGHAQPQIQIDLTGPMLAYHSLVTDLQRLIASAERTLTGLLDGSVVVMKDGKPATCVDQGAIESASRVLDRLLERQRIMLRIPSPGRDSSHARQLPAEPAEPREV